MSDTPRTDEALRRSNCDTLMGYTPLDDVARALERELADVTRQRYDLRDAVVSLINLFDPYGRGRVNEPESECADVIERADELLRALDKADAERCRSAEKEERSPGICTCGMGPISGCWKCGGD